MKITVIPAPVAAAIWLSYFAHEIATRAAAIDALHKAGMSRADAEDLVLIWQARRDPAEWA